MPNTNQRQIWYSVSGGGPKGSKRNKIKCWHLTALPRRRCQSPMCQALSPSCYVMLACTWEEPKTPWIPPPAALQPACVLEAWRCRRRIALHAGWRFPYQNNVSGPDLFLDKWLWLKNMEPIMEPKMHLGRWSQLKPA